ncbi:hypothetical protein KP509_26G058500 [Ceratopteris richardii]|uniref:RING-type E3 ubiquitin transferase n=1 Tax=Ceratopteris richardii TaxID=49495 RepID=A0A8T2RMK7_CERRI|nr:hypothetical protein KP509_26G058500 [Ceratopteris richardii]KAH7297201.1 hypothetical protein KP509_26G058500 [Ceratopteris richardii]
MLLENTFEEEIKGVSMVGRSIAYENSGEVSATSTRSLSRSAGENRSVHAPLKALGQTAHGCSSCFGRVIAPKKGFHGQEDKISGFTWSRRKSSNSLWKFNCVSSCDVLPSLTSSAPASLAKHGSSHGIKLRRKSGNGSSSKTSIISNAGSLVHKNWCHGLGGFSREKGSKTNANQSSSQLSPDSSFFFRMSNWCLMRPMTMRSESLISSTELSCGNSTVQVSNSGSVRGEREASRSSRSSTDSCETSLLSMPNDEPPSRRLEDNFEGGSFYEHDLGMMDSSDRRDTTGLWINSTFSGNTPRSLSTQSRTNSNSSVYSGSLSASRPAHAPFLFGVAHRTRSLEMVSSPSSYLSSPDVNLLSSDMLRPYTTSTLHSPYLSRATSSPEDQDNYHVHSSSEIPIFRSFGQFPLESFEEGQECISYGIEQVFMWEANLILGGIPVHDRYRDLRLDIDSMSYEDLLALEERIGDVCTGLERDTISSCLKSKLFMGNNDLVQIKEVSELKCSICQVDFEEGNELGTLKCGHSHHFQCIEEWLSRKNQCPICKASAFTK